MLRNLFALLVGAILLILGIIFSVAAFAVIAVLGLGVWGYLWWKTREIRRVMQTQRTPMPEGGHVIEGEAVIVEEHRVIAKNVVPGDTTNE